MDEDKVILVYPGFWTGPVFKNGEEALVFTSLRTKSYMHFLDEVHKLVQADRRVCEYVLHCLIHIEDGLTKSFIMSDRDLQRVAKMFRTPKIYVTFKPKHLGMNAPPANGNHSFNHNGMINKTENNMTSPNVNPIPYGGCSFPTENTPHPFPYWSAPYFHGAGPSFAPWGYGAWPGSGPAVDQLGPGQGPVVNQPKVNTAPVVNKPNFSSKPTVNLPMPGSRPGIPHPQARALKRALEVNQSIKDGGIDIEYKRRMLGVRDEDDRCPTDDEDDNSSEDDDESSC